jgi:hypothetical protein
VKLDPKSGTDPILWLRLVLLLVLSLLTLTFGRAQDAQRIRGQITRVDAASAAVRTADGKSVRFALSDATTVFSLTKASFNDVDFGTYVGAVSERMGDDKYSPIMRDSLSWLYRGFELRIIEEKLRGIAVGHTKWDLTPNSTMTHGWVDDVEDRVLSIKYGPTDAEETDVEIGPDVPVVKMALGERGLIRPGAAVTVGLVNSGDGYVATFIFVGKDGVVPAL